MLKQAQQLPDQTLQLQKIHQHDNNIRVKGCHKNLFLCSGIIGVPRGRSYKRKAKENLALMIDNDLLTQSDIISHLDFFINQRRNQHRFEKAIEKWESDREFVSEYKTGNYSKYGVSGIYRKF